MWDAGALGATAVLVLGSNWKCWRIVQTDGNIQTLGTLGTPDPPKSKVLLFQDRNTILGDF